MTHVVTRSTPDAADAAWRPRQLQGLAIVALVGAVLLRAFVLLRGDLDAASLVSLGTIAAGGAQDTSPLELALGELAIAAAPLEYWPMATVLLALWAGYCAAAWIAVRAVTTSEPTRLALLILLIFSPMTLPGLSVWPIGITSASLAIGVLLGVYGAATYRAASYARKVDSTARVALARSGRARGLIALVGGCAMALLAADGSLVNPAIVVPAWALAILWAPGLLTRRHDADGRTAAALAWPTAAVLLPVALYVAWSVVTGGAGTVTIPRDLGRVAGYLGESLGIGALPALAGGPVIWSSGAPAWPVATPPFAVAFMGAQVLLAGVAATALLAGRGVRPWALGLGFVAGLLILLALALPAHTTGSGAQMMGLAAAPALLLVSAASAVDPGRPVFAVTSRQRAFLAVVIIDAFLALSVVSTFAWSSAREPYGGKDYVTSALASLAEAPRGIPVLPQVVPTEVVDFSYAPMNRTDIVFAPAQDRPEFASWTTSLTGLDSSGTLRPAIIDGLSIPVVCAGWAPQIPVVPALPAFDYVVAIGRAAGDVSGFSVRLGDGPATVIPEGVAGSTVYAMVSGSGSTITITPLGNQAFCPSTLRIGQVRVLSPEGSDEAL